MKPETQLARLQYENVKLLDTVEHLQKRLSEANSTIRNMKTKFSFDALYGENQRLRSRFEKIRDLAKEKLAEAQKHKAEKHILSQICLSLRESVKRLQKSSSSEIESLCDELEETIRYAEMLEAENQKLLGNYSQIDLDNAGTYKQLEEDNIRLRGAVTRLQSLLEIATYGTPDRGGVIASMDELREEYRHLKHKIERLFHENAGLSHELDVLRQSNQYVSNIISERDDADKHAEHIADTLPINQEQIADPGYYAGGWAEYQIY